MYMMFPCWNNSWSADLSTLRTITVGPGKGIYDTRKDVCRSSLTGILLLSLIIWVIAYACFALRLIVCHEQPCIHRLSLMLDKAHFSMGRCNLLLLSGVMMPEQVF